MNLYGPGTPVPASLEGIIESVRYVLSHGEVVRYGEPTSAMQAVGDGQCLVFVVRAGMADFDARKLSTWLRLGTMHFLETHYGIASGTLDSNPVEVVDLNAFVAERLNPKPPSAN